jgi:hypothetical protein
VERIRREAAGKGAEMSNRVAWRIVASLSAMVAGLAARRVLILGWRSVRNTDPPSNPASMRTTWPEAIVWGIASGVVLGLARMIAQRGAAAAWRAATGSYPEDMESVSA